MLKGFPLQILFFSFFFLSGPLGLFSQTSKSGVLSQRLDELFRQADYPALAETLASNFLSPGPALPQLLGSLERFCRLGQGGLFEKSFTSVSERMNADDARTVRFYLDFYRKRFPAAAESLKKISLDPDKKSEPNVFQSRLLMDLDLIFETYYRAARYGDFVSLYETFGAYASSGEMENLYRKAVRYLPEGSARMLKPDASDLARSLFFANDYGRLASELTAPDGGPFYLIALLKTGKISAYDALLRNHPRKDYFLFVKKLFNQSGTDFLVEMESPGFGQGDEELLRLKDLFLSAGREPGVRESLIVLERLRLSGDTNLENYFQTQRKTLPPDILEDAGVGIMGNYLLSGNHTSALRFFRAEYAGLKNTWAKEAFRFLEAMAHRQQALSEKKSGKTESENAADTALRRLLLSSPDTFHRSAILKLIQ